MSNSIQAKQRTQPLLSEGLVANRYPHPPVAKVTGKSTLTPSNYRAEISIALEPCGSLGHLTDTKGGKNCAVVV